MTTAAPTTRLTVLILQILADGVPRCVTELVEEAKRLEQPRRSEAMRNAVNKLLSKNLIEPAAGQSYIPRDGYPHRPILGERQTQRRYRLTETAARIVKGGTP